MSRRAKRVVALAIFFVAIAVSIGLWLRHRALPIILQGAVIRQDADPRMQSPISDVAVDVEGQPSLTAKTDFSGYFKLAMPAWVLFGRSITLEFRREGYEPLDIRELVSRELYVVRLTPLRQNAANEPGGQQVTVGNVIVRYATENTSETAIGSETRTFQVENIGNIPCRKRAPCSPNGRWKGAVGSVALDAGPGDVFRNARVSCIAGPCPFTKIVSDQFSQGGRNISVSILGWSDTTTFLLQAEVFRHVIGEVVRDSYPAIFGRAVNFTLPPDTEGPSLEAELGGTDIVFPLGPDAILSWADCRVRVEQNQSKSYRCELKPGYRF